MFGGNLVLGTGSGFGKVILFGEHFVVYGIPSIVSAISDYTLAEVTTEPRMQDKYFRIIDERPETPGYKTKKEEQQKRSIRLMLKMVDLNLEYNSLVIKFGGPLLAASGVGASAASCVAFARALNEEFKLGMDDTAINNMAYEGEKGYHGDQPSGVDNTAATYGGLIEFTKGTPSKFEHIKTPQPVEIVMGNTGKVANTTEVVDEVRKQKDKEPKRYEEIFQNAQNIIPRARKAFESADYKSLGRLMLENQELLKQIGVSNPDLDLLIKVALDHGALGAKLTGTGRGGYMLALTPGKTLQENVANAIKAKGFEVVKTTIGI